MNVITALEKSITHWQEIVAVFGGAKAGEKRERPLMGTDYCALCQYFCVVDNGSCAACPVGDCGISSLYFRVTHATTNADAYTASKAMLARLEELLVEEEEKEYEKRYAEELAAAEKAEKSEQPEFMAGDMVCAVMDGTKHEERSAVSINSLRLVTHVDGERVSTNRLNGSVMGTYPARYYILIHRPTQKGK